MTMTTSGQSEISVSRREVVLSMRRVAALKRTIMAGSPQEVITILGALSRGLENMLPDELTEDERAGL